MTEKEMFEKSFERPSNFYMLTQEQQWEIDKKLGILDWVGEDLSDDERRRFVEHYQDDMMIVSGDILPKIDIGEISDGYHTFNELYEHRHQLFAMVCFFIENSWKSKRHSENKIMPGWFIAGCDLDGQQISYHIPIEKYDGWPAKELSRAPEWDGHTSKDVIERLERYLSLCANNLLK